MGHRWRRKCGIRPAKRLIGDRSRTADHNCYAKSLGFGPWSPATGLVPRDGHADLLVTRNIRFKPNEDAPADLWRKGRVEIISGKERLDLGHIKGSRDTASHRGRVESRRHVEYVVKKTGGNSKITVTVVSQKGGKTRRTLELR